MGRTVDELLDAMSAQELLQWMAFYAVRAEKDADARRRRAEGEDDDVTHWGEESEDDE